MPSERGGLATVNALLASRSHLTAAIEREQREAGLDDAARMNIALAGVHTLLDKQQNQTRAFRRRALLQRWHSWCRLHHCASLPPHPHLVVFFLADSAAVSAKRSSADAGSDLLPPLTTIRIAAWSIDPPARRTIIKDLDWIRRKSAGRFNHVAAASQSLKLSKPLQEIAEEADPSTHQGTPSTSSNDSAAVELPPHLLPENGEYVIAPQASTSKGSISRHNSSEPARNASLPPAAASSADTNRRHTIATATLPPRRPRRTIIEISDTDESGEEADDPPPVIPQRHKSEELEDVDQLVSDSGEEVEQSLLPKTPSRRDSLESMFASFNQDVDNFAEQINRQKQDQETSDHDAVVPQAAASPQPASSPHPQGVDPTADSDVSSSRPTSDTPVAAASPVSDQLASSPAAAPRATTPSPESVMAADSPPTQPHAQKRPLPTTLQGKSFALLGNFPSKMSLVQRAIDAGAVQGRISQMQDLDLLVVGDQPSSWHLEQADGLGVPIVESGSFINLLSAASAASREPVLPNTAQPAQSTTQSTQAPQTEPFEPEASTSRLPQDVADQQRQPSRASSVTFSDSDDEGAAPALNPRTRLQGSAAASAALPKRPPDFQIDLMGFRSFFHNLAIKHRLEPFPLSRYPLNDPSRRLPTAQPQQAQPSVSSRRLAQASVSSPALFPYAVHPRHWSWPESQPLFMHTPPPLPTQMTRPAPTTFYPPIMTGLQAMRRRARKWQTCLQIYDHTAIRPCSCQICFSLLSDWLDESGLRPLLPQRPSSAPVLGPNLPRAQAFAAAWPALPTLPTSSVLTPPVGASMQSAYQPGVQQLPQQPPRQEVQTQRALPQSQLQNPTKQPALEQTMPGPGYSSHPAYAHLYQPPPRLSATHSRPNVHSAPLAQQAQAMQQQSYSRPSDRLIQQQLPSTAAAGRKRPFDETTGQRIGLFMPAPAACASGEQQSAYQPPPKRPRTQQPPASQPPGWSWPGSETAAAATDLASALSFDYYSTAIQQQQIPPVVNLLAEEAFLKSKGLNRNADYDPARDITLREVVEARRRRFSSDFAALGNVTQHGWGRRFALLWLVSVEDLFGDSLKQQSFNIVQSGLSDTVVKATFDRAVMDGAWLCSIGRSRSWLAVQVIQSHRPSSLLFRLLVAGGIPLKKGVLVGWPTVTNAPTSNGQSQAGASQSGARAEPSTSAAGVQQQKQQREAVHPPQPQQFAFSRLAPPSEVAIAATATQPSGHGTNGDPQRSLSPAGLLYAVPDPRFASRSVSPASSAVPAQPAPALSRPTEAGLQDRSRVVAGSQSASSLLPTTDRMPHPAAFQRQQQQPKSMPQPAESSAPANVISSSKPAVHTGSGTPPVVPPASASGSSLPIPSTSLASAPAPAPASSSGQLPTVPSLDTSASTTAPQDDETGLTDVFKAQRELDAARQLSKSTSQPETLTFDQAAAALSRRHSHESEDIKPASPGSSSRATPAPSSSATSTSSMKRREKSAGLIGFKKPLKNSRLSQASTPGSQPSAGGLVLKYTSSDVAQSEAIRNANPTKSGRASLAASAPRATQPAKEAPSSSQPAMPRSSSARPAGVPRQRQDQSPAAVSNQVAQHAHARSKDDSASKDKEASVLSTSSQDESDDSEAERTWYRPGQNMQRPSRHGASERRQSMETASDRDGSARPPKTRDVELSDAWHRSQPATLF